MTWLILFDNQGHTDHVGSRRDVEEQSLSVFWRCEDGWSCEELFELLEGHNSFLVPLELVGLPEKFEEGQAFVSERGYEPAQGSHAPCKLHQVLLAPGWLHEPDGVDLRRVGFNASAAYDEAE